MKIPVRDFDPKIDLPKLKREKMKFLWIENDDEIYQEKNEMSLKQLQRFLRNQVGFAENNEFEITPIFGFWRLEREEAFKTIFDSEFPILTWSVYTYNGVYNSSTQLKQLLNVAGRYNVNGKTYIDGAGTIIEALDKIVKEDNFNPLNLIKAVSCNFILTNTWENVMRVVYDLSTCQFCLSDFDCKKHFNR